MKNVTVDGCGCLQTHLLKPFLDRKPVFEDDFTSYAIRIFSIKTCPDNGKRPIKKFIRSHKRAGTHKKQRRMDTLWNKFLPWKMRKKGCLLENSCNEITAAYTIAVGEILWGQRGIDLDAFKPAFSREPVHAVAPLTATGYL